MGYGPAGEARIDVTRLDPGSKGIKRLVHAEPADIKRQCDLISQPFQRTGDGSRIIAAEEVSVSVALLRLIAERTVAIDRILVRDSQIEIRRLDDGVGCFGVS